MYVCNNKYLNLKKKIEFLHTLETSVQPVMTTVEQTHSMIKSETTALYQVNVALGLIKFVITYWVTIIQHFG